MKTMLTFGFATILGLALMIGSASAADRIRTQDPSRDRIRTPGECKYSLVQQEKPIILAAARTQTRTRTRTGPPTTATPDRLRDGSCK